MILSRRLIGGGGQKGPMAVTFLGHLPELEVASDGRYILEDTYNLPSDGILMMSYDLWYNDGGGIPSNFFLNGANWPNHLPLTIPDGIVGDFTNYIPLRGIRYSYELAGPKVVRLENVRSKYGYHSAQVFLIEGATENAPYFHTSAQGIIANTLSITESINEDTSVVMGFQGGSMNEAHTPMHPFDVVYDVRDPANIYELSGIATGVATYDTPQGNVTYMLPPPRDYATDKRHSFDIIGWR